MVAAKHFYFIHSDDIMDRLMVYIREQTVNGVPLLELLNSPKVYNQEDHIDLLMMALSDNISEVEVTAIGNNLSARLGGVGTPGVKHLRRDWNLERNERLIRQKSNLVACETKAALISLIHTTSVHDARDMVFAVWATMHKRLHGRKGKLADFLDTFKIPKDEGFRDRPPHEPTVGMLILVAYASLKYFHAEEQDFLHVFAWELKDITTVDGESMYDQISDPNSAPLSSLRYDHRALAAALKGTEESWIGRLVRHRCSRIFPGTALQ